MKSPFKRRDPAEALATARAALAAIESERAELQREREAKLLADESEIVDLDKRIERLDRVARARLDQVHALEIAARRHEADQREQQRMAAINAIGKKLQERETAAHQLEAAIRRVAELFAAVAADRGLRGDWPFPAPPYVSWTADISGEALGLLHSQTRAAGAGLFPQSFWPALNRIISLTSIATQVAAHSSRLLAALREMPLPEPESEPIADDLDHEAAA
jgi:hypothetical protein